MSAKFNIGDTVMFSMRGQATDQIGEVVTRPKGEWEGNNQTRTWVKWISGHYSGRTLMPADKYLFLVTPATFVDECADFFV